MPLSSPGKAEEHGCSGARTGVLASRTVFLPVRTKESKDIQCASLLREITPFARLSPLAAVRSWIIGGT